MNFNENKTNLENKNAQTKLEDKCYGLLGHLMHEIIGEWTTILLI